MMLRTRRSNPSGPKMLQANGEGFQCLLQAYVMCVDSLQLQPMRSADISKENQ